MRNSRVLRIMREGGVAVSTKCNFADPREAELAAACGFDCIWIDLEHVPNSITSVGEFVRAAKIYDCDILTRVSRGSYSDIIDIMVEYGAVNACNLDGGSSTVMLYKDSYGIYDADRKSWGNDIVMINNYSLLQKEPRRMPTFFMVRPGSEG